MSETVILLHGLARTKRSLGTMENALSDAGYRVCNIDYPTRKHQIAALADSIGTPIDKVMQNNQDEVHFVTYSLGALVLRAYLAKQQDLPLGKIVLIAPPHGGSPVADFIQARAWLRWLFGPVIQQLGIKQDNPPWSIPSEVLMGILAGSRAWDPFTLLFNEMNDGRVSVSGTKHPMMTDHLVLPLSHFQMTYHPDIIHQTIFFLKRGHFQH